MADGVMQEHPKDDSVFRVLMVGDTVGDPGRKVCLKRIPRLTEEAELDFVIVNGENIAGGSGLTQSTAEELFRAGADVITSGDHFFDQKQELDYLNSEARILRPANYAGHVPGHGHGLFNAKDGTEVCVINLLGQVFTAPNVDSPFYEAQKILRKYADQKIILLDFHAEATSEKYALGRFLDGKISALAGTHTHIQTADEAIFSQGTGYITDLGMCGPYDSILGRVSSTVIDRFLTQIFKRCPVAEEDVRLSGAIFDIDRLSGKTVALWRVHEKLY